MKKYFVLVKFPVLLFYFLLVNYSLYSQPKSVIAPLPLSFNEHWLFVQPSDTVTGSWNRITQLQAGLYGVSSYYIESINKVFICGGTDSSDNPKVECFMYNPVSNSYAAKDTLPSGRAYGKLVRVKDSLYLIGSVNNFNTPDGALYKYNYTSNHWQVKSPVPSPRAHEMAACVWRDSLIFAIGGSTGGFGATVNTVRIYNPALNLWIVLSGLTNAFPLNVCAAQAECIGDNIVVVGGYNAYPLNKVYMGYIPSDSPDSIFWTEITDPAPFGTGVYRIAGGKFGSFMVFGPALSASACINQVWGFNLYDSTWTRFLPNSLDAASRTSIAVKHTADSLYFYLFGGITRDTSGIHFINTAEKYSAGNPVIGIAGNNKSLPDEFVLYQNYPNPFNPLTKIKYDLPISDDVKLAVYDILGRVIAVLVNKKQQAGKYDIIWDGSIYPSGVYFYRLESGNTVRTGKMILLK